MGWLFSLALFCIAMWGTPSQDVMQQGFFLIASAIFAISGTISVKSSMSFKITHTYEEDK